MRLIDTDALMDTIRKHEYRLATKQGSIDYGMFTSGIQQAVDEQPTIDAVPVVRCKDCEYFRTNDENVPYCLNPFGLDDPEPNGFCNYGIGKN